MSRKSFFLLAYFFFACHLCYSQGIEFVEISSFSEAVQKAKDSSKSIFVDCYTEWCGPCKMMAKKEFVKEEAGSYFNPRFVSVKIDMEKGEGPALAKKYDIHAYPTFLFFSAEGKEIGRLVGAEGIADFINHVDSLIDGKKGLLYYQKRFNEGERDNSFLTEYISQLVPLYMVKQISEVLKNKSGEEIVSDSSMYYTLRNIIPSFNYDNDLFLKLYSKRSMVHDLYGLDDAEILDKVWVAGLVSQSVEYDFNVFKSFNKDKFDAVAAFMRNHGVEKEKELVLEAERQIAFESHNCARLFELMQGDLKRYSEKLDHKLIPELSCLVQYYSNNKKAMKVAGKFIRNRIRQLKNQDHSNEAVFERDGQKVLLSDLVIGYYNDILSKIPSE